MEPVRLREERREERERNPRMEGVVGDEDGRCSKEENETKGMEEVGSKNGGLERKKGMKGVKRWTGLEWNGRNMVIEKKEDKLT